MRTICYYFNISFMVLEEEGVLAISVENSVFLLFWNNERGLYTKKENSNS